MEADAAAGACSTGVTDGTLHRRIVQEMIRAIDVAGDFEDSQAREKPSSGRRTWVAVKLASFHTCYRFEMIRRIPSDFPLAKPGCVGPPLRVSCLASRARPYAIPGLPKHR